MTWGTHRVNRRGIVIRFLFQKQAARLWVVRWFTGPFDSFNKLFALLLRSSSLTEFSSALEAKQIKLCTNPFSFIQTPRCCPQFFLQKLILCSLTNTVQNREASSKCRTSSIWKPGKRNAKRRGPLFTKNDSYVPTLCTSIPAQVKVGQTQRNKKKSLSIANKSYINLNCSSRLA
jgi:hypothetical protein